MKSSKTVLRHGAVNERQCTATVAPRMSGLRHFYYASQDQKHEATLATGATAIKGKSLDAIVLCHKRYRYIHIFLYSDTAFLYEHSSNATFGVCE